MYSRKTFVFFCEMFCIFLTISRCYAKIMAKEDDSMDFLTMTIRKQKNIALIAHDNKKRELIDWCEANKEILKKHFLCGTGTTARMITEYTISRSPTIKRLPILWLPRRWWMRSMSMTSSTSTRILKSGPRRCKKHILPCIYSHSSVQWSLPFMRTDTREIFYVAEIF